MVVVWSWSLSGPVTPGPYAETVRNSAVPLKGLFRRTARPVERRQDNNTKPFPAVVVLFNLHPQVRQLILSFFGHKNKTKHLNTRIFAKGSGESEQDGCSQILGTDLRFSAENLKRPENSQVSRTQVDKRQKEGVALAQQGARYSQTRLVEQSGETPQIFDTGVEALC